MPSELEPNDAAIAENVQRTVEQAAIRKVRKLADQLQKEQSEKDLIERRALIVTGIIGLAVLAWIALVLFGSGQSSRAQKAEVSSVRSTALLDPPSSKSAPAKSSIRITILESGDYLVGKRTPTNSEDTSKPSRVGNQSHEALKIAIAAASEGDTTLQIDVAADRNSKSQSYATLLDVLQELQIYRVSVLTAKQPNPSINPDAAR